MTCPSPPSFDNATPININKNKKFYQPGEEVAYMCRQHYRMDGSNVVRCMTGRWIGTPTCRGVLINFYIYFLKYLK